MKVVILSGGLGTRFSEESAFKPKPMIEIGGMPILWHIMKHYAAYGFDDFLVCAGYKQEIIKNFFANYHLHKSAVTFSLGDNTRQTHQSAAESWKVTVVDTGEKTMTGGRVKRVRSFLQNEPFCLTYGDGVSDVDMGALVKHHRRSGALVTLTAVYPPPRFGALDIDNGRVVRFAEKKPESERLVSGGFMVVEPGFLDYIDGDETSLESEPLERVAAEGRLGAYEHRGFWQCMDKLHDKMLLEALWNSGKAPWKVWSQ